MGHISVSFDLFGMILVLLVSEKSGLFNGCFGLLIGQVLDF
jgi:hypothetical protein